MRLPLDCREDDSQILTDNVRSWLTRIMSELTKPTNNNAEVALTALLTHNVSAIEAGAKYRGCTIGIGGPRLGCFFLKI